MTNSLPPVDHAPPPKLCGHREVSGSCKFPWFLPHKQQTVTDSSGKSLNMSSILPTTTMHPPPSTKTSSAKLPIYLVTAIVVILVAAVVLINLFHRTTDVTPPHNHPSGLHGDKNNSTSDHHHHGDNSTMDSSSDSQETETDPPDYHDHMTRATVPSSTTVEVVSTTIATTESVEPSTTPEATTVVQTTTVPEDSSAESEEQTTIGHETSTESEEISTVSEPTVSHFTSTSTVPSEEECGKTCSVHLVESIPRGVHFTEPVATRNAYEVWAEMLGLAQSEIDIFAYKMNLRGSELRYDVDNATAEGRALYEVLKDRAMNGVSVKLIDCQPPTNPNNNLDAEELERLGLIQRHSLDMNTLNGGGGGIQHSKTFIVDDRHLFVGSQNFEWKSFSQKLEIGLQIMDCPCLASQATQLFDEYVNHMTGIDSFEPVNFEPVRIANSTFQFLASPSFLLNSSQSWDLERLLNVIYEARDSVDIAVMQYFPSWIYFKKQEFFSQIDDAIRMSLSRGVRIRILVSGDDKEEQKLMFTYLHSLQVLDSPANNRNVQVKFICIPQTAQEAYKDRKMHAKFLISESQSFIGSSNYAPEYFYKSSGTAILITEDAYKGEFNKQLQAVFNRYWSSKYTETLQKFGESRGYLPRGTSNPFSGWFDFDHIIFSKEKYTSTQVKFDKNKNGGDSRRSSSEDSDELEFLTFN